MDRIPLEAIIAAVSESFKIGRRELLSRNRTPRLVLPRQVLYYLALKHVTHRSKSAIAKALDRDHATIIQANHKIAQRVAVDARFESKLVLISEEIESGKYTSSNKGLSAISNLSQSYLARQREAGIQESTIRSLD